MNLKLLLTLVLVVLFFSPCRAQYLLTGAEASISNNLNNRWALWGRLNLSHQFYKSSYSCQEINAGAEFFLTERAIIIAETGFSVAEFRSPLDNVDLIFSWKETMLWRRENGLHYGFNFEQLVFLFLPSSKVTNATRAAIKLSYGQQTTPINWRIGAEVHANMRSEYLSAQVLQRFRLQAEINRSLTPQLNLGLRYVCHLGNDTQFYFNDRHGLHKLTLIINTNLW